MISMERTCRRLAPDVSLRVVLEDVFLSVAGTEDEEAKHEHGHDGGGEERREVRGVVDEEPGLHGEGEGDEEEVSPNEHQTKATRQSVRGEEEEEEEGKDYDYYYYYHCYDSRETNRS